MAVVAAGLGEDLQPFESAALRGSCVADQARTKSLRKEVVCGRVFLDRDFRRDCAPKFG